MTTTEPLLAPNAAAPPSLLRALSPKIGVVFSLCAATLVLPMTAYTVLINQRLNSGKGLSVEAVGQYYMAEFLFSLLAPLIGWLTDRGGPRVRHGTVVAALAVKALLITPFALGWVRSVTSLWLFGLPIKAAHATAIATLDGVIVARGSGAEGDTPAARSCQAAKLAWQTVGDLAAASLSLVIAACRVPIEGVFWTTIGANALAAMLAARALPRAHPTPAAEDRCQPTPWDVDLGAPPRPISPPPPSISDATSETREGLGACAVQAPAARATSPPPPRAAAGAVLAAAAVALFMLPPTSDVALSSYVDLATISPRSRHDLVIISPRSRHDLATISS
jgi:hypothetical protein